MHRTVRSVRTRFALLAATLVVAALAALPAGAFASTVTSGSATHNQYTNWISYLYAFGGAATAVSPASYDQHNVLLYSDDTATFAFDRTNTSYDLAGFSSGSGTLALSGELDYDMSAHYIHVHYADPQIAIDSPTDRSAVVSAVVSYDPLEDPGPQVSNPTTPTRIDLFELDLSGRGVFSGGSSRHSWTNAPAKLTADGARAFSGGGNGGYSAGQAFGSFTFYGTR